MLAISNASPQRCNRRFFPNPKPLSDGTWAPLRQLPPGPRRLTIAAPTTRQAIPTRAEITPKIVKARSNVSTIRAAPIPSRTAGMDQPYAGSCASELGLSRFYPALSWRTLTGIGAIARQSRSSAPRPMVFDIALGRAMEALSTSVKPRLTVRWNFAQRAGRGYGLSAMDF